MSIDLLFALRSGRSDLRLDDTADWFRSRGYTVTEHRLQENVGQALYEDGDQTGRTWIFNVGPEESDDLSHQVVASLSITGYEEDRFFNAIKEARAFCEQFELLVCDPQGDSLEFLEPSAYLIVPGSK